LAGRSWVTDPGDHFDRHFPRQIELSLALPLGASSFPSRLVISFCQQRCLHRESWRND
jgi:hypothetical protein